MRSFEGYATNGKFSVGCSGASVYIYDQEGNELKRFKDFPYAYHAVFCPGKNVVIVKSTDNWLGFYDLDALCLLKKIPVGKKGKRSQCVQDGGFCISPGGDKFLNIEQYIGLTDHIVVYGLSTYEEIERYPFSSRYYLKHIEYSEQENSYLLLGSDREKDYDSEFIAKFKDGRIYDEVYLSPDEYCDLLDYKNIEISGFTKKAIEWSDIECKEKLYNVLLKTYKNKIK